MMHPTSECMAADDVTIRCRVRHSPFAKNRQFGAQQDMICSMRLGEETNTWRTHVGIRKTQSYGNPDLNTSQHLSQNQPLNLGPEMVLMPLESQLGQACCSDGLSNPIQLSDHFTSFGSIDVKGNRQRSQSLSKPGKLSSEVRIPVKDVMVVDMYGDHDVHQCNITTVSQGFFEFTLESRNGQDILIAFLSASLPKERVMDGSIARSPSGSQHSVSAGSTSFDVEAFTASRMAERVSNETMSEKLRRKVVRVFSSFEECKSEERTKSVRKMDNLTYCAAVSTAFSECACGCAEDSVSVAPAPVQLEKRDSPPRSRSPFNYDTVELAPDMTPVGSMKSYVKVNPETAKRRAMFTNCHLPSGLSVEEEPERE